MLVLMEAGGQMIHGMSPLLWAQGNVRLAPAAAVTRKQSSPHVVILKIHLAHMLFTLLLTLLVFPQCSDSSFWTFTPAASA